MDMPEGGDEAGADTGPNAPRRRLARHIAGSGIEVGPGPYPFRLLPPGTTVRYVDRLTPGHRRTLAAELGADPDRPFHRDSAVDLEPDVVSDLDVDRLHAVPDASEDFVIASHVLEHLAEPIGFLDEMHRVLRPGGTALVLLPDRHRTEDRFRGPTPLGHLVAEHEAGVTRVSDAHLVEYLRDRGVRVPRSPSRRAAVLEGHREQSIHVHCWDAGEFAEVVLWVIEHLGHRWELVDACLYEPPIHYEFGFLLRRSAAEAPSPERATEFRQAWASLCRRHEASRPGLFGANRDLPVVRRWVGQRARAALRRGRALARR